MYPIQDRFPKLKVLKGAKKGDKTPADTESISAKLIPFFQQHPVRPNHDFSLIFKLYQQQFLERSVFRGLIDPLHLALAGDGTPVRTASHLRRKRLCDCWNKGITSCRCKRQYSQPDTNSGWDSHRQCYFNGYHLFMFVAPDSHSDLPIFPMLERASRHDMPIFLHSFFTMKAYLPEFHLEKLLLDSAMDGIAVYNYCKQEGITPFIDLKKTNNGNFKYKETFTIDPEVFLAVSWAYACITMDMKRRKTGVSSAVPKQTANVAASAKHLVRLQNTGARCIHS